MLLEDAVSQQAVGQHDEQCRGEQQCNRSLRTVIGHESKNEREEDHTDERNSQNLDAIAVRSIVPPVVDADQHQSEQQVGDCHQEVADIDPGDRKGQNAG